MLQVPERPWKKGLNEDYKCFSIRVLVAETESYVFSDHDLETPEDHQVVAELRSGGLRQSAFALLIEGLRKEAMYTTLLQLQQNPQYVDSYLRSSSDQKLEIEKSLATIISQTVVDHLKINATSIARECLEYIGLSSGAARPQ